MTSAERSRWMKCNFLWTQIAASNDAPRTVTNRKSLSKSRSKALKHFSMCRNGGGRLCVHKRPFCCNSNCFGKRVGLRSNKSRSNKHLTVVWFAGEHFSERNLLIIVFGRCGSCEWFWSFVMCLHSAFATPTTLHRRLCLSDNKQLGVLQFPHWIWCCKYRPTHGHALMN